MSEARAPWPLLGRIAIAVAFVAALADLGGDLVLDDHIAIDESDCVSGAFDLPRMFGTNFWCEQDYFSIQSWRPLTVLVWWAAARLGPASVVFTLLGATLHAGCVAVGLRLARALGISARAATLGALVFATLAVHAEVIALAVGTAESLAALLILLALWGFAAGKWWCVVPGVAAVLAKETGVLVVPLLITIAVAAPRRDRLGTPARQGIAIAVVAAGMLGLLAWRASVLGAWTGTQIPAFVNPLVELGLLDRIIPGLEIVGRYHRLTLLGGPLSAGYAYDALDRTGNLLSST